MRMDLVKSRYDTYDELYEYCYRVAGTVACMSMPVMGVDPAYKVRGCLGGISKKVGGPARLKHRLHYRSHLGREVCAVVSNGTKLFLAKSRRLGCVT